MTTQNTKPYKILALDGGGFRGVMTAQILLKVEQEIRDQYGCALHEYFDLVTGTSTGSLLAAGIALGKSATELVKLYEDNGERIFRPRVRFGRKFLSRFFRGIKGWSLYDNKTGLGAALQDTFGDIAIDDLPDNSPVLLIPAYDLTERRTVWFCSNNPKDKLAWYSKIPLWKICVCSSAAPTFFPPFELPYTSKKSPEIKELRPFIDGGISVNNPALIGIAHALFLPYRDARDNPPDFTLNDLAVLSIGTGEAIEPYTYKQVAKWGALKWVQRLPDLFLPAPNDVNADVCWQIIRQENAQNEQRVLRLDYALPSVKQYNENKDYAHLQTVDSVKTAFQKKQFGEIDNPTLLQAYKDFANCYLKGQLRKQDLVRNNFVNNTVPNVAIANFIKNNQYPTYRPNAAS